MLSAKGPRLKLVCHLGLRNRSQRSSTGQAPAPGVQRWLKPFDDVGQLVVRVLSAHESRPAQRPAHQQPPVSAEQHSILSFSLLHEMVIGSVVLVRRVDAQQPEPAGQHTEMHVQQEACRPLQRLRPGSNAHPEPVLLPQPAAAGQRTLGHDQVPDLGQWHAYTLDEVPNGGARVVRQVDFAALAGTTR